MLNSSYTEGLIYENLITDYLIKKKHIIITTRYKTPYGEIDIISRFENIIIFSEVKKRKKIYDAILSLSQKQIIRIINSSTIFLQNNIEFSSYDNRIDFFAISNDNNRKCIKWIQNISF